MDAAGFIRYKLESEMVKGNMHACLRDVGRLAGGLRATNAISALELDRLGDLAESLSINKQEGQAKWTEAVVFGRGQPVVWNNDDVDGELDWNDSISRDLDSHYSYAKPEKPAEKDELKIVDQAWVEDEEIEEPANWEPVAELTQYLTALFDTEDYVGYVTEAWWNEDAKRFLPKRGMFDRTAGELIQELGKSKGDIGAVLGDSIPEVGAWIRFNALDGQGVKDSNVTRFKFALVESDNVPIPRQLALIKQLELPVATLVHSGGKSLHAIVRVDADDYEQYRERVDFLYDVCKRNGLTMDRQNRNPSRLSRMPGIMRDGRKQWLVATNIGKPSWSDWREWIEDVNDELPDIEDLALSKDEPVMAPELIAGLLREGHKMLLAGPSKAGKSFSLIQLAISMAEGGDWLGWQVNQGRCLYVNLELDPRSSKHRFWSIYKEHKKSPTKGMIDVWNLRGNSTALDKLAPKLIRRAMKKSYKAVIIDPIYKVLTGDENSAAEMAAFCNQFDKICLALGAATIYCHHHSKGAQGQKSSRDRSSGSGVFARDPDAIIDLIELHIDEDRRKVICNRFECEAMGLWLTDHFPGWDADCSQDDAIVSDRLFEFALGFPDLDRDALLAVRTAARASAMATTGWRVETTLREFPSVRSRNLFFRYPVHVVDHGGLLDGAKADGEEAPWERNRSKREKGPSKAEKERDEKDSFAQAWEAAGIEDTPTVSELAEYLGVAEKTVRRKAKRFGYVVEDNAVKKGDCVD
jgi:RecA-family ATPase